MLPIHTLLHPTDLSKHSDCALGVAGALARACDARLIVLHILQATEPPVWLYDRMAGVLLMGRGLPRRPGAAYSPAAGGESGPPRRAASGEGHPRRGDPPRGRGGRV